MTFTSKLGSTRAGARTRIWLEGSRLEEAGFTPGTLYVRKWAVGRLTMTVCTKDVWTELAREERGTVSRHGPRPVIDIVSAAVAATFDGERVQVRYSAGKIVITTSENGSK